MSSLEGFNVTSKFHVGEAELLVTVRAATAEEFAANLQAAAEMFPAANLVPAEQPAELAESVKSVLAQASQSLEDEYCPVHKDAAPSKWGGVYCPHRDEDGNWCKWRPAGQKKAKATNGRGAR